MITEMEIETDNLTVKNTHNLNHTAIFVLKGW